MYIAQFFVTQEKESLAKACARIVKCLCVYGCASRAGRVSVASVLLMCRYAMLKRGVMFVDLCE